MVTEIATTIGIFVGVVALIKLVSYLHKRRQRNKARNGDYGVETKWAAELVDEGDQLFTIAVVELPNTEMKEVGIIAESKDELRELTVERLEERSDDEIPEDFA